jgi:bifunctional DNase/RNase
VRLDVPIFVEDAVMEQASITPDEEVHGDLENGSNPGTDGPGEERLSIFEDFVESLDLDDLDEEDDDSNSS